MSYYSNEALQSRIREAREVGSPTRADELLLTVPEHRREQVVADAYYQMNMIGGRYSDCLRAAIAIPLKDHVQTN